MRMDFGPLGYDLIGCLWTFVQKHQLQPTQPQLNIVLKLYSFSSLLLETRFLWHEEY